MGYSKTRLSNLSVQVARQKPIRYSTNTIRQRPSSATNRVVEAGTHTALLNLVGPIAAGECDYAHDVVLLLSYCVVVAGPTKVASGM